MTFEQDLRMLAPSVEASWRDGFIVELRLLGVRGAVITDALAEVETHCRESGRRAADAFGPAVDYARALDLPDESRWTPAQLVRTWGVLLLLLAGAALTVPGGVGLAGGRPVEVSAGLLVSAGAALVVMVVAFALGDRLLRALLDHPVRSVVGLSLAAAAAALVGLPLADVVLVLVPAGPALATGVALLAAVAAVRLVERRTGWSLDDPLLPPERR